MSKAKEDEYSVKSFVAATRQKIELREELMELTSPFSPLVALLTPQGRVKKVAELQSKLTKADLNLTRFRGKV